MRRICGILPCIGFATNAGLGEQNVSALGEQDFIFWGNKFHFLGNTFSQQKAQSFPLGEQKVSTLGGGTKPAVLREQMSLFGEHVVDRLASIYFYFEV